MQVRRSTKAVAIRLSAYVLAFLAAYLLLVLSQERPLDLSSGVIWTRILTAVVLGMGAGCARIWSSMIEQDSQDSEADQIVMDLRQHKYRDFVLYLRPFTLDSELPQCDLAYSPVPLSPMHWLHGRSEQFEDQLNDAGAKNGISVVSLGRRHETIGAGRIQTTDKDWFGLFTLLAGTARLILLIPATSEGCLREIFWLRGEGLLAKTLFVQPPAGLSEEVVRSAWLQNQTELSGRNLTLPDFDKAGRLIVYDQAGSVIQTVSLRGHVRKKLAHALRAALAVPTTILWPRDYEYETEREATKALLANRWRCNKCGEGNPGDQRRCIFCRTPRASHSAEKG